MSLLTRRQASTLLGVSWQKIRRLVRSRQLAAEWDERHRRMFDPAAVLAYAIRRQYGMHLRPIVACRMVMGRSEAYAVEHIARRPGGDVDLVVSVLTYTDGRTTYLGIRRDDGQWRPLAISTPYLDIAVTATEHEHRYTAWPSVELAAVVETPEVAA